jgi:hypothetical protein
MSRGPRQKPKGVTFAFFRHGVEDGRGAAHPWAVSVWSTFEMTGGPSATRHITMKLKCDGVF